MLVYASCDSTEHRSQRARAPALIGVLLSKAGQEGQGGMVYTVQVNIFLKRRS